MFYNSYEEDIKVYGDFEMPVPTYNMDKKIDFSVLIAILLVSNANVNEDNVRYIEYFRLNKAEICKELNISKSTLDRKIKYLIEANIITEKNSKNGLIYIINYSKDNKYYVKIQHRILKRLLETVDKNTIKMYFILKIQCDVLKNNNPINRAYLCSAMGLSPKSGTSLKSVGVWTNELEKYGFIKKDAIRIYEKIDGKNRIVRVDTRYTINNLI